MKHNKHIFLVGAWESLNIKKDSSLLLAHALKKEGAEVYLLFEKDFSIIPGQTQKLYLYPFESQLETDTYYMKAFELNQDKAQMTLIDSEWTLHMRSDPPVDQRYTRYIWMLNYLETQGVRITNRPAGIIQVNEKLAPYHYLKNEQTVLSYYGEDSASLDEFLTQLSCPEIIVKPMDSFSGIGVEKINLQELGVKKTRELIAKRGEAIIVQPFLESVYQGEKRALFLGGELIASMSKIPQGSFLANIAQGAKFEACHLSDKEMQASIMMSQELLKYGIEFVAYDLLDEKITEVNVTCPGLVNEVSIANQQDIAKIYAQYFI